MLYNKHLNAAAVFSDTRWPNMQILMGKKRKKFPFEKFAPKFENYDPFQKEYGCTNLDI